MSPPSTDKCLANTRLLGSHIHPLAILSTRGDRLQAIPLNSLANISILLQQLATIVRQWEA